MKEYKANNLHPDPIAMANPKFVPNIIFPRPIEPRKSASKWVVPEFSGTPVYTHWQLNSDRMFRIWSIKLGVVQLGAVYLLVREFHSKIEEIWSSMLLLQSRTGILWVITEYFNNKFEFNKKNCSCQKHISFY